MPKIIDWPTRGLTVEHDGNGWGAYVSESVLPTQLPSRGNLILRGSLDVALRSLGHSARTFSAVCIDFPHIQTVVPTSDFGSTSVVMSLCDQIFARLAAVVVQDGHVLLLCDCWTAPWILAAIESQTAFGLKGAVCWQKRYAGLQDKRGVLDSSFDIIFDLVLGGQGSVTFELIPEAKGFRSQDATQFEQSLRDTGKYAADVEPSRRAKPARLCQKLIARTPDGPVLELMSDSGYFSVAANEAGREFVCVGDDTTGADHSALRRIRARLGHVSSEVALSASPRVKADSGALRTVRFDSVVSERQRAFGIVCLPEGLRTDPHSGESVSLVSSEDPFVGIQRHLRRSTAAGALNTNGDRTDLAGLVSDWFEAAGFHAPCAVRGDLLSCLRLAAWAAVRFGIDSQAGLITASVAEEVNWWLVLSPVLRDRRFSLRRQGRYKNPTKDPRGPYREEYKGARSGSEATKRAYNAPPYRFAMVSGKLPSGFCQIDGFSGVIHAPSIEEVGSFRCEIRVSDAGGNSAVAPLVLNVGKEQAKGSPSDTDVWWLDPPLDCAGGPLTPLFPREIFLVAGCSFSVALRARGGLPFVSLLTPSDRGNDRGDRFWPWNRKSLVSRILSLEVGYGKQGTAKFQNRVFKGDRQDDPVTVHSWWSDSNLSKWGAPSVLDGLRGVLSEEPGIFVIDGLGGEANPRNLRVVYTASPPAHVRMRLQGVPYPLLGQGFDLSRFVSSLGFVEEITPPAISGLACWFGTTPIRDELVVVLHEHVAPTTALLDSLKQALREDGAVRLLVLYFKGSPPSSDGVIFRRIPFDADRC